MSDFALVLGTERFFALAGATTSPGFGTNRQLSLGQRGFYEVRVVGGPVSVKRGLPDVTPDNPVVVQEAPAVFLVDGVITLAAATTADANVYVTRVTRAGIE